MSPKEIAAGLRAETFGGEAQRVASEVDAALASKDNKEFVAKAVELKKLIGAEALHFYLKGDG